MLQEKAMEATAMMASMALMHNLLWITNIIMGSNP